MTDLEKSVLSTIVYYDVIEKPLTGWEVFRYLISRKGTFKRKGVNLLTVLNGLEGKNLSGYIEGENGFYFLKNRNKLVKKAVERRKIADQKWRKAQKLIWFFQLLPFVRLVMISGSLAINNTKENSDIDLLIVAAPRRIWSCRGIITLLTHVLGYRRHGNLVKNRLCLNHYITENSLEVPLQSLYNAQTYSHLVPILETKKSIYKKFQKANSWINDFLVSYPLLKKGYSLKVKHSKTLNFLRKTIESLWVGRVGNFIENRFRNFQKKRIQNDPITFQKGGRVTFDDKQLEFHPDSPEKWIIEGYNKEMNRLGFTELANQPDSGLN